MPDLFDFDPNQGPLRVATVNGFAGGTFQTPQRLMDGAIWLDRGKTADPNQVSGWYKLGNDGATWQAAGDHIELPNGQEEQFGQAKTFRRSDGAIFLHPKFFGGGPVAGVQKPGWYEQDDKGNLKPAPAEESYSRRAWDAVAGTVKGIGSGIVNTAKTELGKVSNYLATGDSETSPDDAIKAQIDASSDPLATAQQIAQQAPQMGGTALGAAADEAHRFLVGAGEKFLGWGQAAGGLGLKAIGSLTGDPALKREASQLIHDPVTFDHSREKAQRELDLEETIRQLNEQKLTAQMLAKQGSIIGDAQGNPQGVTAEARDLLTAYTANLHKAVALERQVGQDRAVTSGVKNYLAGAGTLGGDTFDLAAQLALMEATGGLGNAAAREAAATTAQAGALATGQKAASTLARLGLSEELAAKAGKTITQALTTGQTAIPSALEAAAEAGGKAGAGRLPRIANWIADTSQAEQAGALSRGLAHAGQGVAMSLPGAVQEFTDLYGGNEDQGALGALWKVIKEQPKVAAVMVPMLSERLRAMTTPFAQTTVAGAAKNAAARTLTLAGTSTLADLLTSGGDPQAIGNLPAHIKGLLGLELLGAARGIGSARETGRQAADTRALAEDQLGEATKALLQDRPALEQVEAILKQAETEATGNPEQQAHLKDLRDELAARVAQHDQRAQAAAEAIAQTDQVANDLGVKPEDLPRPKARKLADPVTSILGKPTEPITSAPTPVPPPASDPVARHERVLAGLDDTRKILERRILDAKVAGKDTTALEDDLAQTKADMQARQAVAAEDAAPPAPAIASPAPDPALDPIARMQAISDAFDAPETANRWPNLGPNEQRAIWLAHGMDDATNRTPEGVAAYHLAMDRANRKIEGRRGPSGDPDRSAMDAIAAPQMIRPAKGLASDASDASDASAARPALAPPDLSGDTNAVMDHPELRKAGLWQGVKGLAESLKGKLDSAMAKVAAQKILARATKEGDGDATLPTKARILAQAALKTRDPLKVLTDQLGTSDHRDLVLQLGEIPAGMEGQARDAAAMDLMFQAMKDQDFGGNTSDFHTALRDAWRVTEKKRSAKVDPWQLKPFANFSDLERHVHRLTRGLDARLQATKEGADTTLDTVEKHLSGKKAALDQLLPGAQGPAKEGLEARAAQIRAQLSRLGALRQIRATDPENLSGFSRRLGAEIQGWTEDLRTGHQRGQSLVVTDPTGAKSDEYEARTGAIPVGKDENGAPRMLDTGLVHVFPKGGTLPLQRGLEMRGIVNRATPNEEQLRALWEADHKPGVPVGAELPDRPLLVPGTSFDWVRVGNKILPRPRPVAYTEESLEAGENNATRNAVQSVGHYDLAGFARHTNAILDNAGLERLPWREIKEAHERNVTLPESREAEAQRLRAQGALVPTEAHWRAGAAQRAPERSREEIAREAAKAEETRARLGDPTVPPTPEEIQAARDKQKALTPTDELTRREAANELRRLGPGALALAPDALLQRIHDLGAQPMDEETRGANQLIHGETVLSHSEYRALLDFLDKDFFNDRSQAWKEKAPNRAGVSDSLARAAGVDQTDLSSPARRAAEIEASSFDNRRGAEVLAEKKADADRRRAVQLRTASRALDRLLKAGILTGDDFLLPGAKPHETSQGEDGGIITHRNAEFRRTVLDALNDVADLDPRAGDIASELYAKVQETRDTQGDAIPAGHSPDTSFYRRGGRWIPNPESVESEPLFDHRPAVADMNQATGAERNSLLHALGQNPHVRASTQRMMAHEQLMAFADQVRHGATFKDYPEDLRTKIADHLETKAEGLVHEGDWALRDHLENQGQSYFKPIMEPRSPNEGQRTLLRDEDAAALLNQNHPRHEEVLHWFNGEEAPANRFAGLQEIPDTQETPEQRILQTHLIKVNPTVDPAVAVKQLVNDAMTSIGELNTTADVTARVSRWEKSAEPLLQERAATWHRNRDTVRTMTANDPELTRRILEITDRMDPALFSGLTIAPGNAEGKMGTFHFGKNLLELQTGFQNAVATRATEKATSTFFHEMSHFLSTWMDPAFRSRIQLAYDDHVTKMTQEDPFLRALFGEGSPVHWQGLDAAQLEGEKATYLTEGDRAALEKRLRDIPGELDYLRMESGSSDRILNQLFRPLGKEEAKDGFRYALDLREISKKSENFQRYYRFLNPDEWFAETFGNFTQMAFGGNAFQNARARFQDLVGNDQLQTTSDMLAAVKMVQAIAPGERGPSGSQRLRVLGDAVKLMQNREAPGIGRSTQMNRPLSRPLSPVPREKQAQAQADLENVREDGPTARQANGLRDGLDDVERQLFALAHRAGKVVERPISKLVELIASDALSPASRNYSHVLTEIHAKAGATRAYDEVKANEARRAIDAAFRRENSDAFFRSAEDLVKAGRATEISSIQNRQGVRLFKGKIGEEPIWINTNRGGKVLQVMTDRQMDAYRFVESNGARGGRLLTPELRDHLAAWLETKKAMDQERKADFLSIPGVDQNLADSMWVNDYLPHLYPRSGSGRTLDRILEERDTIANLDRFQRRVFQDYDHALRAGGLLPRLSNPVDTYLLGARESQRAMDLRRLLSYMEERGLAHYGYRDDHPDYKRLELGPNGSLAMKRLGYHQEEPLDPGQEPIKAPQKDLWVHPELEPLVRAGFDYGLAKTPFGALYRTAMLANHVLAPAKLTLSGFHLGTITKLGGVEAMRSAYANYSRLRDMGVDHGEALTRSLDGLASQAGIKGALDEGKRMRDLFVEHGRKSAEQLADLNLPAMDKAKILLLRAGGYSPMLAPARESMEREALAQALSEGKVAKTVWKSYTGLMESVQDALMNHTIAPIKTGHITLDMERMLRAKYGENPDLEKLTQDLYAGADKAMPGPYTTTELGEYARQLTAHADNVFGMVNYKNLMMHPVLKDLMHLWNLSFGWRLGTMRIMGKAVDQGLNATPVVGAAYRGLKRGMGGTGIHEAVEGRAPLQFMAAHGMADMLTTLALGALGAAQFPNWRKKKDEQGNPIEEPFDYQAFRGRLEDLVFPALSDRLNHNSLQNRFSLGYAYDFWDALKNPREWATGHTAGNSPLTQIAAEAITGKDAIGNEIGNPYDYTPVLPQEWAQKIATWMANPDSSAFLVGAAQRALQVPKEFLPISLTNGYRLAKDGENPLVALGTFGGLRKVPDFKGFGQSDATQASMELLKKGAQNQPKTADKQADKNLRDQAVAAALNQRDADQLDPLVGNGYKAEGVKRLKNELFAQLGGKGEDVPREAGERFFLRARFEDRLAILQLARKDEFQRLWPIFEKGAAKGLRDLKDKDPVSAQMAQDRIDRLKTKWGLE